MARNLLAAMVMEPALLRRWDVLEQRISDEGMPELEAGSGVQNDRGGHGCIQRTIGLRLGQSGEGDELVGVEADADHSDPLECFAGLDG